MDKNQKPKNASKPGWDVQFVLLRKYKDWFGNCEVPYGYITPAGVRLGNWVNNQKTSFIKGKLPGARIKKLDAIGFVWSSTIVTYGDALYAMLVEYKMTYGNCNVPPFFILSPDIDINLGAWVANQRLCYNKGQLAKDGIDKLEAIGFQWVVAGKRQA